MMVTGIKPLSKSVRVSGTFKGIQRLAELPCNENIPNIGDLIQLTGKLEKGEHRLVLIANKWKLADVTSASIFEYIKRSKYFKNILTNKQLKTLHKTYIKYPRRLMAAMSSNGGQAVELTKVVGCSVVATRLQIAWSMLYTEIKAIHVLTELGLQANEATKVVRLYRKETLDAVEKNPYVLVPIIGFDRSDCIAKTKKEGLCNPNRLTALATWLSVSNTKKTGSSLFKPQEVEGMARKYGVTVENIIALSIKRGALYTDGAWYTSASHHHMETTIRAYLTKLQDRNTIKFYDYEVQDQISIFNSENKFPLHSNQEIAVILAMNNPVICIQGAAGVGKTEVINAISTINKRMVGTPIYATALSAIAVDRIKQATKLETCSTISKMKSDFMRGKLKISSGSIIVIDECSMLSVQDLYILCTLRLKDIRVIFVGDVNQLPAIGYGAFFKQAIEHFPTATLTKVWRAEAQEITLAANSVLEGTIPRENEVVRYLNGNYTDIVDCVVSEAAQCIAATNKTVNELNNLIQCRYLSIGAIPSCTLLGTPFYVNDKVIFTNNLIHKKVYNGQFAKLKAVRSGVLIFHLGIECDVPQELRLSYQDAIEAGVQLGYAVTGHKAQGAGFDKVLVVLENLPLCNKNWAYTAITRAKKKVYLAELSPLTTVMNQSCKPRVTQRLVPLIA